MEEKNRTGNNGNALLNECFKPALLTLGIAFVILTIGLPFLLHKPWAWMVSLFTTVAWAHVWLAVDTIQRQRAEGRIKYGTIIEKISLVLSVILSISLISFVVIYYFVV
jgi:hypothetical protein